MLVAGVDIALKDELVLVDILKKIRVEDIGEYRQRERSVEGYGGRVDLSIAALEVPSGSIIWTQQEAAADIYALEIVDDIVSTLKRVFIEAVGRPPIGVQLILG